MYHYNKYTECMSCYESIDETNFVLYKEKNELDWKSCIYCADCVRYILETKWQSFIKMLEELDCKATFKRILEEGLPNKFKDIKLSENEIECFYFNGMEQSSKYKNKLSTTEIDIILDNIKNNLQVT